MPAYFNVIIRLGWVSRPTDIRSIPLWFFGIKHWMHWISVCARRSLRCYLTALLCVIQANMLNHRLIIFGLLVLIVATSDVISGMSVFDLSTIIENKNAIGNGDKLEIMYQTTRQENIYIKYSQCWLSQRRVVIRTAHKMRTTMQPE